jgi:hypothetical protein
MKEKIDFDCTVDQISVNALTIMKEKKGQILRYRKVS